MGITEKKFKNEVFEVLEHGEVPGYRRAFHIVLCVAVIYFIFIFLH
ncbi:MAG: hypothetical protein MI749_05620 [Desulfovibrionales bacterium]|nr:hypothetical protein [Desulfovibrionales bacterium]